MSMALLVQRAQICSPVTVASMVGGISASGGVGRADSGVVCVLSSHISFPGFLTAASMGTNSGTVSGKVLQSQLWPSLHVHHFSPCLV